MTEGHAGTKLVADEIPKSRRRGPLGLHSMLCARFPRMRSFTLRSSAHRPLPLLTPVAATVTETSKPHHACSTERADQVTYSRDQARVRVSNFGKRSHNVSPGCGSSHRPNAQRTLGGGRRRVLERAPAGQEPRPLASDSYLRATESPNALLGGYRLCAMFIHSA